MKYIVFFVFSLLTPSEIKLTATQSIFSPIQNSDIYFHAKYTQFSMTKNFGYGIQWWPSNNLYISGVGSSLIIEHDSSFYHHFALGYSNPDWEIKKFIITSLEIGLHRLRYYKQKIYRWFHGGFRIRAKFKSFNFGIDFTRFFYNTWATNRYSINASKSLSNNIGVNFGFIHDEFNTFIPHIGISLGL